MGKAYSQDLRERVILAVVEERLSRRAAAARYRVSDATAVRWLQAWSVGRGAPLRQGGDRRSRLPAHRAWLLALIAAEPDLTLAAVAARLAEAHGVKADGRCESGRADAEPFLRWPRHRLQKSVFASEQMRPDVAQAREMWRASQPELARNRLVFLDETGVTTNMVRAHARTPHAARARPAGQRLCACHGHWKITTFIAGLAPEGMIAPFVVDQPMNREIFTQFVRHYPVPALRPGDIVILDLPVEPQRNRGDTAGRSLRRGDDLPAAL